MPGLETYVSTASLERDAREGYFARHAEDKARWEDKIAWAKEQLSHEGLKPEVVAQLNADIAIAEAELARMEEEVRLADTLGPDGKPLGPAGARQVLRKRRGNVRTNLPTWSRPRKA